MIIDFLTDIKIFWNLNLSNFNPLKSIVSYVDVYKTLAEFIGDQNVPCNEAPDSRSLFNVLTKDDVILREPMMQHSVFQGLDVKKYFQGTQN